MDPFEEFEFKPLTAGLGFHQQKSTDSQPSSPARNEPEPALKSFNFLDDEPTTPLTTPLPRREAKSPAPAAPATPASSPVDDILRTLKNTRKLEIETDRRQRADLRQPKAAEPTWKAAAPRVAPLMLDLMLVSAASLLCLIITLIITKVDLLANLANPDTEGMIYVATAALVLTVGFVYYVVHRVFLGHTPGEWAYDLRVGRPEQAAHAMTMLKVIGRSLVVILSGVILLPLIGLAIGRDLSGAVVRLPLMRKG